VKRYKEKVNKKVDGQRKRKPEKKHKGESGYQKSTNGMVKDQKEKKGKSYPGNKNRGEIGEKKSDKKREKKQDAWK
jgi:hypothetical protein